MADIDIAKLSKEITDKYQITGNTFFATPQTNPKDKIDVEVGDSKQQDFYPQTKLIRWDNEVNFSIRLKDEDTLNTATVSTDKDKIIWDKGNIKIESYDFTEDEGGYKLVWYLKQKPLTNKVEFTIQSKGLDFFYQPKLTPEEIAQGASRPENVVGSYAVYHQTKGGMNDSAGKEYKTGKAFHIYRPHIIDASGAETWGILHIENGIYSVEILQDFLDKAVYPIKSNDTIGYTTIGAGANTFIGNAFVVTALTSAGTTAGSSGIMSKFQVAAWDAGANNIIRLAIYTLSGSTYTLLSGSDSGGMTVARTTKPTQDSEWTSSSGVSGSIVNGTLYWIAQNNNDSSTTLWVAMDNGYTKYVAETYSNFPPSSISGLSVGTAKLYSIYATYTASGGGAATPKTDIIWFEED